MTTLYLKKPIKPLNCINLKKLVVNDSLSNYNAYQHRKNQTQNLTLQNKSRDNKNLYISLPGIQQRINLLNKRKLNNTLKYVLDPHEEMIRKDMEEHKKAIEKRYNASLINNSYTFPRIIESENIHQIANSSIKVSIYQNLKINETPKRNQSFNEFYKKTPAHFEYSKLNSLLKNHTDSGNDFHKTLVLFNKNRGVKSRNDNYGTSCLSQDCCTLEQPQQKKFNPFKLKTIMNNYMNKFPKLKNCNVGWQKHNKIKTKSMLNNSMVLSYLNAKIVKNNRGGSKIGNYKNNEVEHWKNGC